MYRRTIAVQMRRKSRKRIVKNAHAAGNPTTYRGTAATWTNGRLASYKGATFTYDGQGRRASKGSVTYMYDSQSRLIKQSNGLEYYYDHSGVCGAKYNGSTYVYRKDIQGNICAILDSTGNVVVEYKYDAWGNHAVLNASGGDIEEGTHIGNMNPFRYRGYYYDTETGLYYLKSRYYDPETGRFISIDGISYLDAETVNGLNLYAYCLNNPVMNVDPDGTFGILAGILIGLAIGAFAVATGFAIYAGVTAYNNGLRGWDVLKAVGNGFLNGLSMNSLMAILIFGTPIISSYISGNYKRNVRSLSMNVNENPDNPLKELFGVNWDELELWQKIVGGIGIGFLAIGALAFVGGVITSFIPPVSAIGVKIAITGAILMIVGSYIAAAAMGVEPGEWN